MRNMLRKYSLLGILSVFLVSAAFYGCSTDAPLGVNDQQESISAARLNPDLGESEGAAKPTTVKMQKIILADQGGFILIPQYDWNIELAVAPSGMDNNACITVEASYGEIEDSNALILEFGPDGLVFSTAAELHFNMGSINPAARAARLLYYNPDSQLWQLQATESVVNGYVTFEIYHFSKYAISD